MLLIPFSDNPATYKLFIVLEDDNIERIQRADPGQVAFPLPGFEDLQLAHLFVGYANEQDKNKMLACVAKGQTGEALALLSRGFEFRPDLGDYDGPLLSIKPIKPKKGEGKQ